MRREKREDQQKVMDHVRTLRYTGDGGHGPRAPKLPGTPKWLSYNFFTAAS